MNCRMNKILSSEVNSLFGQDMILQSILLESTLRYVALSRAEGDVDKINPVSCACHIVDGGNEWERCLQQSPNTELMIFKMYKGEAIPIVDKEGWNPINTPPYPVAPFLSKFSKTEVYCNEEAKQTIVFVENTTDRWTNAFSSSLFRILPWRFENGATADEIALFKAINDKDASRFTQIVNELVETYDFRGKALAKALLGWGCGAREQTLRSLRRDYDDKVHSIAMTEESLARYYAEIDNINAAIAALTAKPAESNDDLYNFFSTHKQLTVYSRTTDTQGDVLYYTVRETLEYYDQDAFKRVYSAPGSCVSCASPAVKDVLWYVFGANKGVFRTEAMFKLTNFSGIYAVAQRTPEAERTHMGHPHIYNYRCLGANGTYIMNYLKGGNWELALEQTIAATKNLNWGDYSVIRTFIGDIERLYNTCTCIINDKGEAMTPHAFREYCLAAENRQEEDNDNG